MSLMTVSWSGGVPSRDGLAMAFDDARERVVMRSTCGSLWDWDGESWELLTSRGPRGGYIDMVYDAQRRRLVLFGPEDDAGTPTGETWEWDGETWARVAVTGPPPRNRYGMAYDRGRGRTVLFAGLESTGWYERDTWEWKGSSWSRHADGPAMYAPLHQLAYDEARGVTVAFSAYLGEHTWTWDGTTWREVATTGPGPTFDGAMVRDSARDRIVLFGGNQNGPIDPNTWEWDGTTWTARWILPGPAARERHAMAYDARRQRVVMAGGWTNAGNPGQQPFWEFDGDVWTPIEPRRPPWLSAAAYDAAHGGTVIFGGIRVVEPAAGPYYYTEQVPVAETWRWDGAEWLELIVAQPPARRDHAMATDAARARVVLFGGEDAQGALFGDTWELDGAAWAERGAPGPSPRTGHAMTYDAARGATLLFGGADASGARGDPGSGTARAGRRSRGPVRRPDRGTGSRTIRCASAQCSLAVTLRGRRGSGTARSGPASPPRDRPRAARPRWRTTSPGGASCWRTTRATGART